MREEGETWMDGRIIIILLCPSFEAFTYSLLVLMKCRIPKASHDFDSEFTMAHFMISGSKLKWVKYVCVVC